jgi:hypothetical protein
MKSCHEYRNVFQVIKNLSTAKLSVGTKKSKLAKEGNKEKH